MLIFFGLIGWLPDIVLRIQGTVLCALALIITVPCYIVVVYKVKKQGRKIAAPSSGGAPTMSQATAMTVGKNSEALRLATKMTKTSAMPGDDDARGAGTSDIQTAAAAPRKKLLPKLETRMLKLCLGITCLSVVSYAALFTVVVLDLSHSFNYIYSLNHVGNPVIYCMISKAYRNDVLDTARLILATVKKTMLRR